MQRFPIAWKLSSNDQNNFQRLIPKVTTFLLLVNCELGSCGFLFDLSVQNSFSDGVAQAPEVSGLNMHKANRSLDCHSILKWLYIHFQNDSSTVFFLIKTKSTEIQCLRMILLSNSKVFQNGANKSVLEEKNHKPLTKRNQNLLKVFSDLNEVLSFLKRYSIININRLNENCCINNALKSFM